MWVCARVSFVYQVPHLIAQSYSIEKNYITLSSYSIYYRYETYIDVNIQDAIALQLCYLFKWKLVQF